MDLGLEVIGEAHNGTSDRPLYIEELSSRVRDYI